MHDPEEVEHKPPFCVEYRHGDRICSFNIWAESWPDAERRLKAIAQTGKVYGSNVISLPMNPLTMPFVAAFASLFVWFKNLGKRR